jgi:hypothetical protein
MLLNLIRSVRQWALLRSPPAKQPIEIERWRRLLLEAADLIEREGWIQGAYKIEGSGYSVVGALLELDPKYDTYSYYFSETDKFFCAAMAVTRTLKTMPPDGVYDMYFLKHTLIHWNDAPTRTKEEVVATMRASAYDPKILDY